jgi:hypothetical protein
MRIGIWARTPFPILYKPLILVISLAFFLISCVSAPRVPAPAEEQNIELSILPAGARVYLWADVERSRPFLETLFSFYVSAGDFSEILDNTYSATAAIFSAEQVQNQGHRFFLAAIGSYPRFRANIALFFNRGWKRQKSLTGSSFWRSDRDNISLALGSNIALVSDLDPYQHFSPEIPSPGFLEFKSGFGLAGWVNNPSDSINTFLTSLGIPLSVPAEEFFFGAGRDLTQGAELWELVFRVRTPSEPQARALLTLFSMARHFVTRGPQAVVGENDLSLSPQDAAMLLFANNPELEGDSLTFRLPPLSAAGIALLFEMFSVYSS